MKKFDVAVLMGSDSDLPIMQVCLDILSEFKISYEYHVLSAHRTPKEVSEFAQGARERGLKVIIIWVFRCPVRLFPRSARI